MPGAIEAPGLRALIQQAFDGGRLEDFAEIEHGQLLRRVLELDFMLQQPGLFLTLADIPADEWAGVRVLRDERAKRDQQTPAPPLKLHPID